MAIAVVFGLASCASVGNYPKEAPKSGLTKEEGIEWVREYVKAEMATRKIPGLAISVADSSGVLWSEGFGIADKGKGKAFTGETVSNPGSVSKTFTATAILRLVEMGKMGLDAPISRYLPEFSPRNGGGEGVTVRRIMSHHSGLQGDAQFGFWYGTEKPDDYPNHLAGEIPLANSMDMAHKPDEIFVYSNIGYSLLGLAIERVSGMSFNDFMTKEVFGKLGMKDSSFLLRDDLAGRYAMGYLQGKETFIPYIRDMPAGSLATTSDDMAKYLSSMLAAWKNDSGLLSQKTMREIATVQNPGVPYDFDFRVGLTWWLPEFQCLPGELIVGHGGDLPPYHAQAAFMPERDIAVFVMVNGVEGVGSFSLTKILENAFRTFAIVKGQEPIAPAQQRGNYSKFAPMPPELKEKLPGLYASPKGLVEVKRQGDLLLLNAYGQWFELVYHEDASITLSLKLFGLIPIDLPVFKDAYVTVDWLDGVPWFNLRVQGILLSPDRRVTEAPTVPNAAWKAREGEWANTVKEPVPVIEGFRFGTDPQSGFWGMFQLSEGRWSFYPMQAVSESDAKILGKGLNLSETLWAEKTAEGEVIHYSGYVLRRK